MTTTSRPTKIFRTRALRGAVAAAFGRCRVSLNDPLTSEHSVVRELTTD